MSNRLWFLVVGFLVVNGLLLHNVEASSSRLAKALRTVSSLYNQKQWARAAAKAQGALSSVTLSRYRKRCSSLYMYMGASLFQLRHKAIAWQAFQKALQLRSSAALPAGASSALRRFFGKARRKLRPKAGVAKPSKPPAPRPVRSGKAHIGWILGWVSVALTGGALGVAGVSGGNARVNAGEASTLMRSARRNSYTQVLMEPIINEIHGRATTYATVTNVSFGVAGGTALAATGFFLWAFLASKSKSSATQASSMNSTTLMVSGGTELK